MIIHGCIGLYECLELIWAWCQHVYHSQSQPDSLHMFSLVYFFVDGVFPHSVSTRWDPCVRVCAPLMLASPHTKKQNRTGGDRLSTWAKRGGIWTDAWVYLHYWVVIWVARYREAICQWFSHVTSSLVKILANRLTRDPKIVIHSNSCIIFYVFGACTRNPGASTQTFCLHWPMVASVVIGGRFFLKALQE